MDTLKKIEDVLEGALRSVRTLRPQLALPDEGMDLETACGKLYALLGNRWSFDIAFGPSYHEDGKVNVTFKIWDAEAKQHYEGPSLTAAVNSCVAAHGPEPADALKEAEGLLPTLAGKALPLDEYGNPIPGPALDAASAL